MPKEEVEEESIEPIYNEKGAKSLAYLKGELEIDPDKPRPLEPGYKLPPRKVKKVGKPGKTNKNPIRTPEELKKKWKEELENESIDSV